MQNLVKSGLSINNVDHTLIPVSISFTSNNQYATCVLFSGSTLVSRTLQWILA